MHKKYSYAAGRRYGVLLGGLKSDSCGIGDDDAREILDDILKVFEPATQIFPTLREVLEDCSGQRGRFVTCLTLFTI